jgi:hypothetical protein
MLGEGKRKEERVKEKERENLRESVHMTAALASPDCVSWLDNQEGVTLQLHLTTVVRNSSPLGEVSLILKSYNRLDEVYLHYVEYAAFFKFAQFM